LAGAVKMLTKLLTISVRWHGAALERQHFLFFPHNCANIFSAKVIKKYPSVGIELLLDFFF
jgi:hypothetical protein